MREGTEIYIDVLGAWDWDANYTGIGCQILEGCAVIAALTVAYCVSSVAYVLRGLVLWTYIVVIIELSLINNVIQSIIL